MTGRSHGSRHYGKNENLTLTEAELAATGKHPQPTKRGAALRYRCPVHGGDNQNSLELTLATGRFFCHKCRCWGFMDWAREEFARERGRERASHRSGGAAGRLPGQRNPGRQTAHKESSPPPPPAPSPAPPPPPVEPVREGLEALHAGYRGALPGGWGERYLEFRGIPMGVAREHGVGYAARGAWAGRDWKGGRLVTPHHRPDGVLVNLYGRAVGKEKTVPKPLKHDHLAGNKGWFNARALREGEGPLYVCEAALDALALIAAGYTRTVAIYGTHGWRWDWVPPDVGQIVIAADADEGGAKTRETIGVGARLRGIEVAYLTDESYGGEKDAAEAYALGKLRVGAVPVASPVASSVPEGVDPSGGEELLRVSRRLWLALRARGRHHRGRHFSDHVAAVVRELFPLSPGAAWSVEWADAIARAGAEYVARRTPEGASPVPSQDEEKAFAEVREAAEREDRRAYRLAVRAWVDASLSPFEDATPDADAV